MGGSFGAAVAASITRNVVSLGNLLAQTSPKERHDMLQAFDDESFKEEFMDAVVDNPKLWLLRVVAPTSLVW